MTEEIRLKDMTEEQLNDLEAQIAELRKAKKSKRLAWKPEFEEQYFLIGAYGQMSLDYYNTCSADNSAYKQGNMFPTEQLAEAELERRQVIREIEELIDKYDAERGGEFVARSNNYTFIYNCLGWLSIENWSNWNINPLIPYFSSREVAQRILNEIGEDRIKLLFTKYPIVRGDE